MEYWRSLAEKEDYLKLHTIEGYADPIEGVWIQTVLAHLKQSEENKGRH